VPPLRTAALSEVADILPRSGARLLAAAIMSNHLHLVIQQGERPLSALMQPLLRRLARLVQMAHDLEGPVFWRHYGSVPCRDPNHVRNAIVYTHLNPVRAGLCKDPSHYRWTSHALYAESSWGDLSPEVVPLTSCLDPSLTLPLFATGPDRSATRLRDDYRASVEWRLKLDRAGVDDDPAAAVPERLAPPGSGWGDLSWGASLSPLFRSPLRTDRSELEAGRDRRDLDLATIAKNTLAFEAPGVTLSSIRGRGGGRESSRLRHAVIRRLHAAGYPNVEIAPYLGLSESAVSYALCVPRSGR
jgi:REP element-mobilizing transposase RayT